MFEKRSAVVAVSIHAALLGLAITAIQAPLRQAPPVMPPMGPFIITRPLTTSGAGAPSARGSASEQKRSRQDASRAASTISRPRLSGALDLPPPLTIDDVTLNPMSGDDLRRLIDIGHGDGGLGIAGGGGDGTGAGDRGSRGGFGNALGAAEVDRIVEIIHFPPPVYPRTLRAAGLSGEVMARFIVDTTGRVQSGSVTILRSTNEAFSAAVVQALSRARFHPARVGKRPVAQLVEQRYPFVMMP